MSTFGPYSPIKRAGDLYFASGQIGIDPKTKLAEESIAGQTHQALKNLANVLEDAQLSLSNVVKITIFLQNMEDYAIVNSVYMKYFQISPPARSCVEVSALPKIGDNKILIEVEAIAYKPS
jgi:2-iminobutanoate/2-iminopropanoate deaminase